MSKTKLALDVVADLRSLANSIETFVLGQQTEIKNEPASKEKKAKKVDTSVEENQPTLEELRAVMAAKNRDGHREAVKAIIQKYEPKTFLLWTRNITPRP
ncbi:MAG: rRNA biogenesis protein rrp5 [Candidatus Syntrophopropionicum ammoniitolerans]